MRLAVLLLDATNPGSGRPQPVAPVDRGGIHELEKRTGAPVYRVAPTDAERIDVVAKVLGRTLPRTQPSDEVSLRAPLPEIVGLASTHAIDFARAAAVLIASEHYVQEAKARSGSVALPPDAAVGITIERRTLDSEVALVQLVEDEIWLIARDVLAVDGRPLQGAARVPLTSYRARSTGEAWSHFKELAEQGARFNIGGIRRNLNVPTLALWFLTPAIRERFAFKRLGSESVDGVICQVVRYEETVAPELLDINRHPVPVGGRFWIVPASGVVLKTELILPDPRAVRYRGTAAQGRALITVQYAYAPSVQAWVPVEMAERYDDGQGAIRNMVLGTARYTDYRKFDVTARIVGPQY
jgi:hypothetical protein